MANNYVQFAGIFTHLTADEERWLRHALRDATPGITNEEGLTDQTKFEALCAAEPWRNADDDDACAPDFQFDFDSNEKYGSFLMVYAEESGSAWAVGQLAHAFLRQLRPQTIWVLNWATFCDKTRIEEFGGGAVVATAKEVRALSSYAWAERMQKHFKRTGELPPVRKVKRYKPGRFGAMNENEIAGEMGWNADSMVQLMSTFIAERGLTDEYVNFLGQRAREEEEEAGADGSHTCRSCDGFGYVVNPDDADAAQTRCEDCGGQGYIECSPPCEQHKKT